MKLPVKRTETLYVRVSPPVKERLASAAKAHQVSTSAFLEALLNEFFSDTAGLEADVQIEAELAVPDMVEPGSGITEPDLQN